MYMDNCVYMHAYYCFLYHCIYLAIRISFTELSAHVSESEGSVILSLNISNTMSTDVTVMIITTDETANGELKFCKHTIE